MGVGREAVKWKLRTAEKKIKILQKKVLTNPKRFDKMPKAIDERNRGESREKVLFFEAASKNGSSMRRLRKIKNLEKSC